MTGRLENKVALITGAAMGMGAAHARAFAAEGARVVIADLDDEAGTALAAELGEAAHFVHLDVTKPEDWNRAVTATVGKYGKLNVLVNNAGIFTTGSLEDYTLETWEKTLTVNLTSVFLGLKACRKELAAAQPASVINVSSSAGLQGYPGYHGYSASKWGLRGLTRSAALELADFGIRVNSIHPGGVATPLLENVMDIDESAMQGSTLNRLAYPEEVSGLLIYLASDEASFVSGGEYAIDGGITAGTAP